VNLTKIYELHKANQYGECVSCHFVKSPCPTIQALEDEKAKKMLSEVNVGRLFRLPQEECW
jgi:hypothetical protein